MQRRTLLLLILVVVLLVAAAVVAVVVAASTPDESADDSVTLGGMSMSVEERADLTRDTMGERDLARVDATVPLVGGAREVGVLRAGTRLFELRARPVRSEYREGQTVAAWAYNGQVPGPVLQAVEGERVEVTFTNDLPRATTVHWHGVDVPWKQDGVPGVTQEPIEPGDSYTYTFTATPAGTRWYHTHGSEAGDEASQLDMGLSGALVIMPRKRAPAAVDRTLVLDDWLIEAGGYNAAGMLAGHGAHNSSYNVFTINGRAAPDVADIVVKRGQLVRLRFVNASTMSSHPMHLHGHQFRIVALDGNPVASPLLRNVATLAPGETADVEFVAENPGVWMLHCHDLHHAGAGMHMLIRYEGFAPVGGEHGSAPAEDH